MARKPKLPPFSLRLTKEQRADLEDRAGRASLSMGGYVLSVIFNTPEPRRRTARPSADLDLLARLLAAVGKIGSNVNQLAYVANTGGWPDSRALAEAVADVRWMRDTLMLALGVTPPDYPQKPPAP